MATVSRTWVFAAGLEGLADVGDSAIPVNWDSGPAMLEFGPLAAGTTLSERARGPVSAGNDWPALFPGLPAGAVVTDAQCTGYNYQRFAADKAWRIRMRIVDSAGASVHSAGDLVDMTGLTGNDASKVAGTGLAGSRAVDAGKQASSTLVALELQFDFTGVLGGVGMDVDFDDIAITLTYTVPAAASQPFQPHRMPQGV